MSDYGFTAAYDAEDRLVSWDRADTNLDQPCDLTAVGNWDRFPPHLIGSFDDIPDCAECCM